MEELPDNRKTAATSRTADRVLRLLREIARSTRPMGVSRAAAALGISTSATHRLLRSLVDAGLVEQDENRGYAVGPGVLELAQRFLSSIDVREHCRPLLEEVRDMTKETTCLIVRRGENRVCVDYALSGHDIAYIPQLGETLPVTLGATGRAFLSTLSVTDQRRMLRRMSHSDKTDDLSEEVELSLIAEGVRRGYFLSKAERIRGMNGVAFPIKDAQGRLRAAVSVVGPADRWTAECVEEVAPAIIRRIREYAHIKYHLGQA